MKMQNALVSNILNRSQRYFAHVTTVTLSWRVQNIVVIGRVYFTLECFEFSSNFEFDRNMLSGTGAPGGGVLPMWWVIHMCRGFDPLFSLWQDRARSFGGIFSHPPTPKRSFGVLKLPILKEFDLLGPKFHFSLDLLGSNFQRPAAHPHQFSDRVPPPPPPPAGAWVIILTHLLLVQNICVGELGQHWFRWWLGTEQALPVPMLTYCQLDRQEETLVRYESEYQTFHSWNVSENVICEMAVILSRLGRWVPGHGEDELNDVFWTKSGPASAIASEIPQ